MSVWYRHTLRHIYVTDLNAHCLFHFKVSVDNGLDGQIAWLGSGV